MKIEYDYSKPNGDRFIVSAVSLIADGSYSVMGYFIPNKNYTMKKQMIDYVKKLGGDACYSGEWPQTLFVQHRHKGKEYVIAELIKKFGRHTQIRFE